MVSLPPSRHRISRIDGKIDDCRFEMIGVDLDRPKSGAAHRLDLDPLAQRALEKFLQPVQKMIEVDRLGVQRLSPGKGKQPALSAAARCAPRLA